MSKEYYDWILLTVCALNFVLLMVYAIFTFTNNYAKEKIAWRAYTVCSLVVSLALLGRLAYGH